MVEGKPAVDYSGNSNIDVGGGFQNEGHASHSNRLRRIGGELKVELGCNKGF